MNAYYPLAVGNTWTYKQKDGSTYTNSVTDVNGSAFTMHNSAAGGKSSNNKAEGGVLYTDAYEAGNMQPFLKENAAAGDTWDISFTANGIESILTVTVKSTDGSTDAGGKTYKDVMLLEGESKMKMNGNIIPLNFFTQWHYAKGVGLVLTTSRMGAAADFMDVHELTGSDLK